MALFPDPKIKQAAADYLMKEGELTGAEYFAVMRGAPNLLVGVEDGRYYNLHRDLFRQTLEKRARLVEMLHGIQADLISLERQVYSKELKHFQRKLDAFHKGKVGVVEMMDLLAEKGRPFGIDVGGRSMGDIESTAYLLKTQMAQTPREKDLVQVEHDLDILLKVADLQATEKEVRTFGPRLNQFVALADSLLRSSGVSSSEFRVSSSDHSKPETRSQELRELISSSIDYYALALDRKSVV